MLYDSRGSLKVDVSGFERDLCVRPTVFPIKPIRVLYLG